MAGVAGRGVKIIERNRRFEDYRSLKQHFQYSKIDEVLYNGWQITAGGAAEVLSGERAITYLGAEAVVYVKSVADAAGLDGDAVYVEYQDDTGAILGPITHLLNVAGGAGTDTEHALGNENVLDTIAAGQGTTSATLTDFDGTAGGADTLVGKYMVVYSGNDKGIAYLIQANSAADPSILTVTPALGAAANDDLCQIQTYPCNDFYRLRRMWCETEAPEDNAIELCDDDGDVWYGEISDWGSRSGNSHHFTQPEATCRTFLGKVHLNAPIVNEGDTVLTGFNFDVTFTPKAIDANDPTSDVTLHFYFYGDFVWEPCIELAGATDVTFKIGDLITIPHNILVETAILEVYDISGKKTDI